MFTTSSDRFAVNLIVLLRHLIVLLLVKPWCSIVAGTG